MARTVTCKDCGEERPHYAKGFCRPCWQRQWRRANPEKVREWRRRYRAAHREELAAYQRQYQRAHYKGRSKKEYIYLLYAPEVDRYKIGQSSNPKRREKELSKGPVEVGLIWSVECKQRPDLEAMLHDRFRKQRIRGEWFQSLTDEQIQFVMDL